MNRSQAAEYALEALKKAGAQKAAVRAAAGYTEELNAETGEFSLYRTLYTSNLSIKAIKDGKKGMAHINIFDKDAIDEAVEGCIAAAAAGVVDEAEDIAEKLENKKFESGILSPDKEALYSRIEEYTAEIKTKYPKINLEQFIAKYERADALFINTNGVEFDHATGHYEYASMFTGQDGEKSTSFNHYQNTFTDLATKFMDMGLMRAIIEDTVNSFDPTPVSGKYVGPVIIAPTCFDDLLQSIILNFAGEGALLEGTAIWKDKLERQVAHPSLTVSMNPYDARVVCGERVTPDGFSSVDTDIIKDGVLKGFLLSQYGANKLSKPRSKNMAYRNQIVAPGQVALADMIKSTDQGLLINRFSGGEPAGNGDFSGVAKNSFAIKNGKIAGPVSETMISGNLQDLLLNVRAISRETTCNGTSVLPWIALDGVTVSGK